MTIKYDKILGKIRESDEVEYVELDSRYLKLDQTTPQTITASPVLNWMTNRSVPFIGTGGYITQDNAYFYYDSTTHNLYTYTLSTTALTVTGWTEGWVLHAGAGGTMVGENEFNYVTATNTLNVVNIVSTGNLVINTNSTTALKVEQDGVNDNVFIVDTTNGRVGIGTTAPLRQLTLSKEQDNSAISPYNYTGGLEINLGDTEIANAYSQIWMKSWSTDGVVLRSLALANNDIDFRVGFTNGNVFAGDKFTIKTNGNVGIGTTTPGYLLEVNGTFKANTTAPVFGAYTMTIPATMTVAGRNVANTFTVNQSIVYSPDNTTVNLLGVSSSPNATSNGTRYLRGVLGGVYPAVNTGVTESGYFMGCDFGVIRNLRAAGTDDSGTLAYLVGFNIGAGHYNTNVSATPVTTLARGLRINLYHNTGTIATLTGIEISTSFVTSVSRTTYHGLLINNISGATNNYAILTNAGNIVFNEGGDASTDFRVEGDTNQNLLFTDASADKVGIGTGSPTAGTLHVVGTIYASDKFIFTQTDGNEYIDSLADGYLDLAATTGIRLTSPLTRVTGDLYVGNNAAADPAIVFDGDTNDGQITYYEDEDEFGFGSRVKEPGTFAEIYVADGATEQTILTGATYTKVTMFTTNGEYSNCTADAANDKITITKTGKYLVNAHFNGQTDTANTQFNGAIFLNGTICPNLKCYNEFIAADKNCSAAFSGIIDVTTANWEVDFRLAHDDGGNVGFTLVNGSILVTYLGET